MYQALGAAGSLVSEYERRERELERERERERGTVVTTHCHATTILRPHKAVQCWCAYSVVDFTDLSVTWLQAWVYTYLNVYRCNTVYFV